jgi:hypothetical protein
MYNVYFGNDTAFKMLDGVHKRGNSTGTKTMFSWMCTSEFQNDLFVINVSP